MQNKLTVFPPLEYNAQGVFFMRRFRFRYGGKRRRKISVIGFAAVLILFLFCGLFLFFEARIGPFMTDFTVLKGRQLMSDFFSQTVNDKLEELDLTYSSLIETKYSASGEIQSLNTDIVNINKLKNAVTLEISEKLADYYEVEIDFPLANALNSEFLSGVGPSVTFNSSITGSVTSDFRSEFESGGVNQTVHRLYIDITGDLIVVTGGSQEPIELTTSVLVGETVIVGDVPGWITNY